MSPPERSRRRFLEIGGAALLAGLGGCSAPATSGNDPTAPPDSDTRTPPSTTPSRAATPTQSSTSTSMASDQRPATTDRPYARVYQETIGSVVMVAAGRSQGTGFAFDDNHVVTNAHVVDGIDSTDIRFNDGQWASGSVVGTDPHSDLAAIAVDEIPASTPPLPFIQSAPVIGQQVVAIGNPFNLNGSVTAGIISGLDRSIPAPTGFSIPDAIQTDAAVNPGNSGGPLMSLDARMVAVIASGGGENIAFGISAALTERVVPRLIENGSYEHAYMGVTMTDVTPTIAEENGLRTARGLLIVEVIDGGPADDVLHSSRVRTVGGTGIPVGGDVLLSIDGQPLVTTEDLGSYLALHTEPEQVVQFDIIRNGRRRTVNLELGTRPDSLPG